MVLKLCLFRVEGRGNVVITDVIYSSETSSEEEKPSSQTKEKYESIKVNMMYCELEDITVHQLVIIAYRLR